MTLRCCFLRRPRPSNTWLSRAEREGERGENGREKRRQNAMVTDWQMPWVLIYLPTYPCTVTSLTRYRGSHHSSTLFSSLALTLSASPPPPPPLSLSFSILPQDLKQPNTQHLLGHTSTLRHSVVHKPSSMHFTTISHVICALLQYAT